MKIPTRFAVVLAVTLVCTAVASGRSPEDTLTAFVAAVQEEGLPASVRFIHSAELTAFRTEFEPEIAKRVQNNRTRPQFVIFTDPYNKKQIRPFKDDADFVAVFIKWLSTSGMVGVTTFENASVQPLGTVIEGDLRHVVARFVHTSEETSRDVVSVTSMKMDGGRPMLLLLPELKNFAHLIRQPR